MATEARSPTQGRNLPAALVTSAAASAADPATAAAVTHPASLSSSILDLVTCSSHSASLPVYLAG